MASSPKSDPQREAVYKMERHGLAGLNRARLSRVDLRRLMELVCAKYRVDPPVLRWKAMAGWSGVYEWKTSAVITLSTTYVGGLSAMTLLHEVAHYLVHSVDTQDNLPAHGPEFVGVYGDLLESGGFIPFGSWALICAQYKVQRMNTGRLSPAGVMRALKKRAA
jgi:hypothetical protein